MEIGSRLKHAWNAFFNKDPTSYQYFGETGSYNRPDRVRLTGGNERSIITSIFNRISIDIANIDIKHCDVDDEGRFLAERKSGLNNCLTTEANLDQTGSAFIQDIVMSMLDEGVVAIVPIDTNINPDYSSGYDITSMRTGKILEWYPTKVRVRVYNDRTGRREEVILPKKIVAIVENPLYAIINEPNSTVQRLKRKLALLDITDEQTASNKLDLIIQLPYLVKTETRKKQAKERMSEIENQLAGSKYGIAYTDGTEKITQLNRSLENNLLKQVEYLTNMLYSQLGITQSILDGTADERTMLNYYNRTIKPIINAIVDEMKRKFLSKTARTQGQSIKYFRDPFELVSMSDIAQIGDSFTRNEILTSNEIRQGLGFKPSSNPRADELVNSNIAAVNNGYSDPNYSQDDDYGEKNEDQQYSDDQQY